MNNFRVKNLNSYAWIGALGSSSVMWGLLLVSIGQTVENHVSLFETLGFQITFALYCGLVMIFGYFIGSRMSTDANKEQAPEQNPPADNNLKLKNVSIKDDVTVVLCVIGATLITVTGLYYDYARICLEIEQ